VTTDLIQVIPENIENFESIVVKNAVPNTPAIANLTMLKIEGRTG